MPMPRLPETHHSTTAIASAFQVNMKSAMIAPTWNAPIKKVVIQPIGSRKVLSFLRLTVTGLPGGFLVPWLSGSKRISGEAK
jgi:hypothetical protein